MLTRKVLLLGLLVALTIVTPISGASVRGQQAGLGEWVPLGPYGGSIQALAYSPGFATDQMVFAAVANNLAEGHGIFRSIDGGLIWAPSNTGLDFAAGSLTPYVYALATSPGFASDRLIYAATAGGVAQSTDRGASWQLIASGVATQTLAISPNFVADQTLFTRNRAGDISRSTDGGATWQTRTACCGIGLAVSPNFAVDRVVFAGRMRSSDGGQSFGAVLPSEADIEAFVFSPQYTSDGRIFAGSSTGEIWTSSNRGDIWLHTTDLPAPVRSLAISPFFGTDRTVWAGTAGAGVWRSTDGGATWQRLTSGILAGADVRAIAVAPTGSGELLAGTETGAYHSTNRGTTWTASATGLLGIRVEQVAVAGLGADRTFFASTGRGLFVSTDGGNSWSRSGTVASRLVAVSPNYSVDRTVFATGIEAGAVEASALYRSTDGGRTWMKTTQPDVSAEGRVWAISPLYGVDRALWLAQRDSGPASIARLARSRDGGQTWDPPVEIGQNVFVRAIALSPAFDRDQTALAATEPGPTEELFAPGVIATIDGGASWPYGELRSQCPESANLTACWPLAAFSVAFSPDYAMDSTAFVGTRALGVAQTTCGCQSPAWHVVPFPAASAVKGLAVSPAFRNDNRIWAGTAGDGVFASTDRGLSWSALSAGLADRRVNGLAVSPNFADDRTIFAATESGVWLYRYPDATPMPYRALLPVVYRAFWSLGW